jgi:tetratricopeptide (TPR) repeat protein
VRNVSPGLLLVLAARYLAFAQQPDDPVAPAIEAARCHGRGMYEDAARLYDLALQQAETGSSGGPRDRLRRGRILVNFGALENDRGRYGVAERFLVEACDLLDVSGGTVVDRATCHHNLATCYRDTGRYDLAEAAYRNALALLAPAAADTALPIAATEHSLGVMYRTIGSLDASERLLLSSLRTKERLQGRNHPDLAPVLKDLAEVRTAAGKLAAAEPLLWRALRICDDAGARPSWTAALWNALASLQYAQHEVKAAARSWQKSLKILQTAVPEHANVGIVSYNLGNVERSLKRFRDADEHLTAAVTTLEAKLGPEHPHTAYARCLLARMYSEQKRFDLAQPLFGQGLAAVEKAFGSGHPQVASLTADFAKMYAVERDYPRSERLYQRSIAIYEQTLGPQHPTTAAVQKEYAMVLRKLRRKREARELERTASLAAQSSVVAATVDVLQLSTR